MRKHLVSFATLISVVSVASLPVAPVFAASAPSLGSLTTYGVVDINSPVPTQVRTDATNAYNFMLGQPCDQDLTNQDLNNRLLSPGVYCFTTPTTLTGQIQVNGLNNPNSIFIFKFTSSFTMNSLSQIVPMYSARPENIYFQIGDTLTINSGTLFKGTAIVRNNIVLANGASIEGRLASLSGVIQANFGLVTLNCPTCSAGVYYGPAQLPTVTFCSPSNVTIAPGQSITLSATGGDGSNYTWSASDLVLNNPYGPTFTVNYAKPGTHSVIVTSAGQAATCTVNVTGSVLGASTGFPNTGFGGAQMLLVYILWAIIFALTGVHIFGFRKARV